MRRAACLLLLLLAGCQEGKATVPAAYRADLENICDAEARSGALEPGEDPNRRAVVVAQWIATRIQSREGRTFLVELQKLKPAEKGAALRAEAARVGLASCPLAEVWK